MVKISIGLLILVLLAMSIVFHYDKVDVQDKLLLTEKQLDSLLDYQTQLKILQLADSYLIGNNADSAEIVLRSITDQNLIDLLDIRFARIAELRKVRIDSVALVSARYRAKLATLVDEYEQFLQSKDVMIAHQLDSFQFQDQLYNIKISSLSEMITTLDNEVRMLKRINESISTIEIKKPSGKTIMYLGPLDDGMADGKGIGLWNNGCVYEGYWKDNNRHGEGTYKWPDGEKYVGTFVEDKRQGQGTYIWKNKEVYIGEWKDDKRHGQGLIKDKNGKIKYEGEWKDDTFVGKELGN